MSETWTLPWHAYLRNLAQGIARETGAERASAKFVVREFRAGARQSEAKNESPGADTQRRAATAARSSETGRP